VIAAVRKLDTLGTLRGHPKGCGKALCTVRSTDLSKNLTKNRMLSVICEKIAVQCSLSTV
jgi:hypothetical protein